jgi:hypothetical protein
VEKAWSDLPENFRDLVLHGSGKRHISMAIGANRTSTKPF